MGSIKVIVKLQNHISFREGMPAYKLLFFSGDGEINVVSLQVQLFGLLILSCQQSSKSHLGNIYYPSIALFWPIEFQTLNVLNRSFVGLSYGWLGPKSLAFSPAFVKSVKGTYALSLDIKL